MSWTIYTAGVPDKQGENHLFPRQNRIQQSAFLMWARKIRTRPICSRQNRFPDFLLLKAISFLFLLKLDNGIMQN